MKESVIHWLRSRKRSTGTALALLLVLCAALLLPKLQNKQTAKVMPALPSTFTKRVDTDLYYPTKLPDGYRIEADGEKNTVIDERLAAYTITDGKTKIIINHQASVPEDAFRKLFSEAREVKSPRGLAYIASLPNNKTTLAGLRAGSVSVLLSSVAPVDTTLMEQLLLSLEMDMQ